MLKISLITLTIVVVLSAVGVAWARHSGYCGSGDYFQHVTERVSRKLDLNEGQSEKLQGVAEALRGLRTDWSGQRTRMTEEVQGLLAAPALDRAMVRGLLDERRHAMDQRVGEIVEAFADFSDTLAPEQRTRLAELIAKRAQHRFGPPGWAH